jgi:hypothetical protein
MRVSHKKISVATSHDSTRSSAPPHQTPPSVPQQPPVKAPEGVTPLRSPIAPPREPSAKTNAEPMRATPPGGQPALESLEPLSKRRLYFEDVEVRRSRSKGVACRVTLKKGDQSFVGEGEADGLEHDKLRIELAAKATLAAIAQAEGDARVLGLEGCKSVEAFDREFVFVGLTTRLGRETSLLTGSAEIKESPETASVLAVLDATNRWIDYSR